MVSESKSTVIPHISTGDIVARDQLSRKVTPRSLFVLVTLLARLSLVEFVLPDVEPEADDDSSFRHDGEYYWGKG